MNYSFKGLKAAERNATHTILKSVDQDLENTLDQPNAIVPVTQQIKVTGSSLEVELVLSRSIFMWLSYNSRNKV